VNCFAAAMFFYVENASKGRFLSGLAILLMKSAGKQLGR
jgi:hypothetical protein